MNEEILLHLNGEDGPVYTGSLAESMGVDRRELFPVLTGMTKEGRLVRSIMYLENGTSRPTIGFGWSCPQD